MDLYADLPLAKGAADAEKTPAVWAKGVPAFVPGQAAQPKVSMLPAALAGSRAKAPPGAASGPSAAPKPAGRGVSLAFRPASVGRKAPTAATARGNVFEAAKPTATVTENEVPRGGLGFVAATTWTQVTVHKETQTPAEEEASAASADGGGNSHFFQATYRDEYHPSRPNNYEAFCEERAAKIKMDQVKRELEQRQREQERESKREREQFAKDVNEGKTPAITLPSSAGRGRGMTVPAWMKKKIEESASKSATQPIAEDIGAEAEAGQFEDAAPRGGLGFVSSPKQIIQASRRSPERKPSAPPVVMKDEFGRDIVSPTHASHRGGEERGSRQDERNRAHSRSRSRDRDRDRGRDRDRDQRSSHTGDRRSDRSSPPARRRTSRFDRMEPPPPLRSEPRPGRVVLLQNMVGPGEVDGELEDEVKEECASKYGPVSKCVAFEVRGHVSAEEAVQIFVEFQHQIHADQAMSGLNGRFFGGRRVKASYYDEEKFKRRDLGA